MTKSSQLSLKADKSSALPTTSTGAKYYVCVLAGLGVGLWSGFELWNRTQPILALLALPVWGAVSTTGLLVLRMAGVRTRILLPESCWRCAERSPIPGRILCAECVRVQATRESLGQPKRPE